MQDAIVREITVKAPRERVYKAITDPKQIITWFPDSIEGALEVGQQVTFDFGTDGTAIVRVIDAKPHEYFAFRWYTGNDAITSVLTVPNTLVEFHLQEVGSGTKVTLKESGFASLPGDRGEKQLNDNTGGWKYMMDRLEKLMNEA